jgi:hypothetical protein
MDHDVQEAAECKPEGKESRPDDELRIGHHEC